MRWNMHPEVQVQKHGLHTHPPSGQQFLNSDFQKPFLLNFN